MMNINPALLKAFVMSSFDKVQGSASELQDALELFLKLAINRLEMIWTSLIHSAQMTFLEFLRLYVYPTMKAQTWSTVSFIAARFDILSMSLQRWAQLAFGWLQIASITILGHLDFQTCVLVVLTLNMVLLGFMVFQKVCNS